MKYKVEIGDIGPSQFFPERTEEVETADIKGWIRSNGFEHATLIDNPTTKTVFAGYAYNQAYAWAKPISEEE